MPDQICRECVRHARHHLRMARMHRREGRLTDYTGQLWYVHSHLQLARRARRYGL